MNVGTAIDKLHKLRKDKSEIEKEVKLLKDRIEEAEINVREMLNKADITMARGEFATASLTEMIVPAVESWDDFYEHIQATGDFHLLERRPSSAAYRELL